MHSKKCNHQELKINKAVDSKLVPCIKLAKAINATLPEKRRLTGYHIESLAIKIFKNYSSEKTHKLMLQHFFEEATNHVKKPITDSSGQSVHVDEYLGSQNSIERRILSNSLNRIARRMKNADGARSLSMWQELFE